MADFTLPELGENITSGDVLRVLVKPGDVVAKDQPVIELETDKATIEVPSLVAGRVAEVKVRAGEKIDVGQVILTVEESGNVAEAQAKPATSDTKPADTEMAASQPSSGTGETQAADMPAATSEPAPTAPPSGGASDDASREKRARPDKVVDISRGGRPSGDAGPPPSGAADAPPAPASPSVRRMARELGVDIHDVPGSGPGGRISGDDVKAHVNRALSHKSAAAALPEGLPDFGRWGPVERKPMRGVRRKTAEHLAHAWATVPHVTQHDAADVTALEDFRRQHGKTVELAGGKLTVTAILTKVVALALRKFPQFNASVDMTTEEVVYKQYVNIGIAVDTDRGLLVPVIRDADRKSTTEIAVALVQMSDKARSGKLALDEMQGGSFSVSNLGGIGGTAFTPIVNWPEVATLGVSRTRTEPVFRDGQVVPRLMLPLSLSYDHRLIDGADGIRFLRWIIDALEQPFVLLL